VKSEVLPAMLLNPGLFLDVGIVRRFDSSRSLHIPGQAVQKQQASDKISATTTQTHGETIQNIQ
jgi:hypothetical protein